MNREYLDKLTLEQLQEECVRYKLPPKISKTACIDILLAHFERHGDHNLLDFGKDASTSSVVIASPPILPSNVEIDHNSTQIASSHSQQRSQIEELKESMQLIVEHMQLQQQVLVQLAGVSLRSSPITSQQTTNHLRAPSSRSPTRERVNRDAPSVMASASTAQAVKLLANQISTFSGTEEEDVELWIRKVERVATIHGVQDGVTLLAASSKLNKSAREWFDLDDG